MLDACSQSCILACQSNRPENPPLEMVATMTTPTTGDGMRYVVAMVVAFALVGLGLVFVGYSHFIVRQKAQEEARLRGENSDVDANQLHDFGTELSPAQLLCVTIANLMATFWFVLIPATIAICLAIAAMAKPTTHP
jgi:hypothetical protein